MTRVNIWGLLLSYYYFCPVSIWKFFTAFRNYEIMYLVKLSRNPFFFFSQSLRHILILTLKKCLHSKQDIIPEVTNSLDFDKEYCKAELTLWETWVKAPTVPWLYTTFGICLKFVHGIISVHIIMLTYDDSLQTRCYMSDTLGLGGHNMVPPWLLLVLIGFVVLSGSLCANFTHKHA